MSDTTIITTNRSELFDFIASAKDRDAAMQILGQRLVETLLGHHADFGARTVLAMGGIDIECQPIEPKQDGET